ncbi:MAG TPA: DUF892 family protein [bacterium]|nr:DUF892 family protein [bacterium]
MEENKKTLITWLNDAYSMEESIADTLEGMIEDAEDYPEFKTQLEDHLEQTKSQAERVRGEIERLGGDVSTVKKMMADAMGSIQAVVPDMAKDKVIKNAIAGHATEHLEMASYMALAAAADELGETETADVCRKIMEEEKEMGKKTEKMLPEIVKQYLRKQKEMAE